MSRVTTLLLAGGKGTRLAPLTDDDAKPAIPFGGVYRIIDFTLSNCINSNLNRILVLTQFKSMSLDRHINQTWRNMVNWQKGEFIETVPAQQRLDENWYRGNADAVFQNIYAIEKDNPDYVVVLAADHVYKMDYQLMLDHHIKNNANVTVGGLPVPVADAAGQFGVMQVDKETRIVGFEEKPASPKPIPSDPGVCLASMGIYIFSADFLFEQLCKSNIKENTRHDFGRDVIPSSIKGGKVFAYQFRDKQTLGPGYWRDVGTLDSYFDANMDLLSRNPEILLDDSAWPVWHTETKRSPARVFPATANHEVPTSQISMISAGCRVQGVVSQSVLGPGCIVGDSATVQDCILFDEVIIEPGAHVRGAIIGSGVKIPSGCRIGFHRKADEALGVTITEQGRAVISRSPPYKCN